MSIGRYLKKINKHLVGYQTTRLITGWFLANFNQYKGFVMEKTGPNSLDFNFIYLFKPFRSSDFDDKFQQVSKNIKGLLLLLLFPTFIYSI